MISDIELLNIELQTLFVIENARIERENDPDQTNGPRFWLAGCRSGNVMGVGADLDVNIAAELTRLGKSEESFGATGGTLLHHERYTALLEEAGTRPVVEYGLVYRLPHALPLKLDATIIKSDSERGRRLYDDLSINGMPQGMVELGFRGISDLWAPWCAVMIDGEVTSIAFAARISEVGAELGLATAKAHRGRGLALAAVAGWSSLEPLQARYLFYSTDRSNTASRKVAARLNLPFIGHSVRFT